MAALADTVPVISLTPATRQRFLALSSPAIDEADIAAVTETLRSGQIASGTRTEAFERAFADYVGVPHAVAVSSGSAALHLALLAAGVGPGDDVVVPAMTFVATANAVLHAGANPQLCDVNPVTGNLRVEDVDRVRTNRTKAVIPVHFAGRCVDMTSLEMYTRDHGLRIINDAAHAIESTHRGRSVAQYGTLSAFSFHATKNITTGEGGMVTTSDASLAERIRALRYHGLADVPCGPELREDILRSEAVEAGFKYTLTEMQAALGLRQLARVEQLSRRRRAVWKRYDDGLTGLPLRRPAPTTLGDRHALHLYTVLLNLDALTVNRDQVFLALHEAGIGTGVHYRGVHLHPLYRDRLGYAPADFPLSTLISERTLSLPLSAAMTERDADAVILALTSVLRRFRR